MEERYVRATLMLARLQQALAEYESCKEDLSALEEYMDSGLWQEDYEADEAGQIPAGMQRGVLSQDGLYELLQDAGELVVQAKESFGDD